MGVTPGFGMAERRAPAEDAYTRAPTPHEGRIETRGIWSDSGTKTLAWIVIGFYLKITSDSFHVVVVEVLQNYQLLTDLL